MKIPPFPGVRGAVPLGRVQGRRPWWGGSREGRSPSLAAGGNSSLLRSLSGKKRPGQFSQVRQLRSEVARVRAQDRSIARRSACLSRVSWPATGRMRPDRSTSPTGLLRPARGGRKTTRARQRQCRGRDRGPGFSVPRRSWRRYPSGRGLHAGVFPAQPAAGGAGPRPGRGQPGAAWPDRTWRPGPALHGERPTSLHGHDHGRTGSGRIAIAQKKGRGIRYLGRVRPRAFP